MTKPFRQSTCIHRPSARAFAALARIGLQGRKPELVVTPRRTQRVERLANREPQRGRTARDAYELGVESERLGKWNVSRQKKTPRLIPTS
jgi:hypothetical protein